MVYETIEIRPLRAAGGNVLGQMGLFVRKLNAVGLYALDIVQLRIAISLVLVGLYLLIFARDKLRVRLRDLWCFAGTGIVSLLLFSWCYFPACRRQV